MLAECGNITRAAERLFISQPALSIYISSLEKSLGIRLFERVGKKFVLTCAGELYVEKARKMLALKAEFDEALSEIAGGKRETADRRSASQGNLADSSGAPKV